jgi:hypothetical protein
MASSLPCWLHSRMLACDLCRCCCFFISYSPLLARLRLLLYPVTLSTLTLNCPSLSALPHKDWFSSQGGGVVSGSSSVSSEGQVVVSGVQSISACPSVPCRCCLAVGDPGYQNPIHYRRPRPVYQDTQANGIYTAESQCPFLSQAGVGKYHSRLCATAPE